MDFRFKMVYKDGTIKFQNEDFRRLANAFLGAAGCVFFDDGLDYIDVYDDKDKKLATFYS